MNSNDSTQAEPTPATSPAVKTAGQAVDFRRYVRMDSPQIGDRFTFAVSIHAEFPGMPAMTLNTGQASFQVYPTPDQARSMAAMLLELADEFERASAPVIQ